MLGGSECVPREDGTCSVRDNYKEDLDSEHVLFANEHTQCDR